MVALWALLSLAWAEVYADVQVRAFGSGEPIEATVRTPSEALKTDASGRVRLELPEGTSVTIEAEGYAPQVVSDFEAGQTVVFLEPVAGPIEIVVEAFQPDTHVTRHVVDREEIYETPGIYEDAVRLVQSLPGVATQREFSPSAGDLSVRGSAAGDNRYLLDGVEIPYLYHYNQYASVFPASQLSQLELYSSTFGPAWGDATGAVVEATTAREQPKRAHGSAFASFVNGGADLRVPLKGDWWIGAGGRRSYLDLAGESSDQYTLWPIFHDYTLRLEQGTGNRGFGLFWWGAGDRYDRAAGELDVLDPLEANQTPRFTYRRSFDVVGVRQQWDSPERTGRVVGAWVLDRNTSTLDFGGSQRTRAASGTLRIDHLERFSDAFQVEAGLVAHPSETRLTIEDPGDDVLLVAEEAPELARGVAVDDRLVRLRGGGYAVAHVQVGGLRLMPGLRVDGDSAGGGAMVQPRATVRAQVSEQTALKLAGGRYTQRPQDTDLIAGPGDPGLPLTDSTQVAGGIEQTIAGRMEFVLEGYHKWLRSPLLHPIDQAPFAVDRGDASGIELLTRYRIRQVVFLHGWLGISQSHLVVDGERVPGDGHQPVNAGLVGSLQIAEAWTFGLRYRFGSGLRYTPLDGSVYNGTTDQWSPRAGAFNSARYPGYHKVDVRLSRDWSFSRWTLQVSGDLWFIPPASAQLYPTYNFDYTEQGWVRGPLLFPLLFAKATF